jgi:predicted ATP-grasp superfamily ATP-dependent carboligase
MIIGQVAARQYGVDLADYNRRVANILLTGGRAPVALELARVFHAAGHSVFMAESVRFPLAGPSRAIRRNTLVPAPNGDPAGFVKALLEIVRREGITLLVPTCEELFYVARGHAALLAECRVLAEPLERLRPLHNKWLFSQRARGYGLRVPATRLLTSAAGVQDALAEGGAMVLKPVYSRFAARTIIRPTAREAARIIPSAAEPWVAQEFVHGRQICTYSLARGGRVLAHTAYPAELTAGPGTALVFRHIEHPAALAWVREFVAREQFSGQIAFDFIETEAGELYALECNPRATSGVHLLASNSRFAAAFFDEPPELVTPCDGRPAMLAAGMVLAALPAVRSWAGLKAWAAAFAGARDVVWRWDDPAPALLQGLGLANFLWWAARRRISPVRASTLDIEWNGAA